MRVLLSLIITSALLLACESNIWMGMPPFDRADPLFRFVSRGRVGFIDRTGRVVIPPTPSISLKYAQFFYDGLLSLGIGEGPFLDTHGRRAFDNGFYRIWDFSEGLAAALETIDSKWGFIDHSGKFAIPPQFPFYPRGLVQSFSDGLVAVEVAGKLGYIDHSGKYAIAPQFAAGTEFRNGIARVVAKGPCSYLYYEHFIDPCVRMSRNPAPATGPSRERAETAGPCKWRFIDKTGKQIIPAEFDAALAFQEGLAAVKVGERWGFIDRSGKLVIAPSFISVQSFSNGLALANQYNNPVFIDKTGAVRLSGFIRPEPFSEGLAVIWRPGGYTYIDTRGEQPIKETFVLASRFFHGLAHVKVGGDQSPSAGGTFAYIDTTGKRVFTYQW